MWLTHGQGAQNITFYLLTRNVILRTLAYMCTKVYPHPWAQMGISLVLLTLTTMKVCFTNIQLYLVLPNPHIFRLKNPKERTKMPHATRPCHWDSGIVCFLIKIQSLLFLKKNLFISQECALYFSSVIGLTQERKLSSQSVFYPLWNYMSLLL